MTPGKQVREMNRAINGILRQFACPGQVPIITKKCERNLRETIFLHNRESEYEMFIMNKQNKLNYVHHIKALPQFLHVEGFASLVSGDGVAFDMESTVDTDEVTVLATQLQIRLDLEMCGYIKVV